MGKGRKKVPDGINALKGNPGKRKRVGKPPAFTPGADAPKWLSEYAREEWDVVADELSRLDMLDRVGTTTLAAYCEAAGQIREATEVIINEGLTSFTVAGGLKPHPAVAMRSDAIKIVKSFACEFGFTPSSKAGLSMPGSDADDDLGQWFRQHGETG